MQGATGTGIDEAIQQPMCCKTDPICRAVKKVQAGVGMRREVTGEAAAVNGTNFVSAIV